MSAGGKLTWMFELLDKMSGPTSKIEKALSSMNATAKSTATGTLSRLSAGFTQTAHAIGSGASMIGEAGSMLAGPLVAAGAAVGGLAVLGGKWLTDSLRFREDTIISLGAMLHSKQAAQDVFAQASKFSAKTPFSNSQVASGFERLVAAGFKTNELEKAFSSVGDFAGTDVAKLERTIAVFAKIKSVGKLTGESLQELGEAGLPIGKVFDAIGKSMGKSSQEVQQLMAAGKISADQGIGGIMATIQGTFGGRMKEASNSLTGLWSTLKAVPEDILFNPAVAGNMEKMIEPIKGFVRDAIALLGPDAPGGKLLGQVFVGAGEIIGRAAMALRSIDWAGIIGRVGAFAAEAWPKVQAFFEGFTKAVNLQSVGQVLAGIFDAIMGRLQGLDTKTLERLGTVVGEIVMAFLKLAEVVITVGATVASVADFFIEQFLAIPDSLEQLFGARFVEIGGEIVSGMMTGMLGLLPDLLSAGSDIAGQLEGTVKGALGIASPSTVFADLGKWTGLGFLQGLDGSGMNDAIANPMTAMPAMQPSQAVAASVAGGAFGAQGGAQYTFQFGDLVVNVDGADKNSEQIATEAATSLKAKIASELGKLSL